MLMRGKRSCRRVARLWSRSHDDVRMDIHRKAFADREFGITIGMAFSALDLGFFMMRLDVILYGSPAMRLRGFKKDFWSVERQLWPSRAPTPLVSWGRWDRAWREVIKKLRKDQMLP